MRYDERFTTKIGTLQKQIKKKTIFVVVNNELDWVKN